MEESFVYFLLFASKYFIAEQIIMNIFNSERMNLSLILVLVLIGSINGQLDNVVNGLGGIVNDVLGLVESLPASLANDVKNLTVGNIGLGGQK